jgi:hypothetical protein
MLSFLCTKFEQIFSQLFIAVIDLLAIAFVLPYGFHIK